VGIVGKRKKIARRKNDIYPGGKTSDDLRACFKKGMERDRNLKKTKITSQGKWVAKSPSYVEERGEESGGGSERVGEGGGERRGWGPGLLRAWG